MTGSSEAALAAFLILEAVKKVCILLERQAGSLQDPHNQLLIILYIRL